MSDPYVIDYGGVPYKKKTGSILFSFSHSVSRTTVGLGFDAVPSIPNGKVVLAFLDT
jgi:hypothetical protein